MCPGFIHSRIHSWPFLCQVLGKQQGRRQTQSLTSQNLNVGERQPVPTQENVKFQICKFCERATPDVVF